VRNKDDVPKVAMGWDDKRKAEDGMKLLDALETVLRDCLRVHSGLAPIDAAIEEILEEITRYFTIEAITCIMEETVSVRKRLSAHVQWRSAAEPLLFRIVEEIDL